MYFYQFPVISFMFNISLTGLGKVDGTSFRIHNAVDTALNYI